VSRFAIIAKADWDHERPVADHEACYFADQYNLVGLVERLTGRAHVLSAPSVARKLRKGQRVYVAADKDHGRAGVLVEPVPATA
jgi:hypothetical protein